MNIVAQTVPHFVCIPDGSIQEPLAPLLAHAVLALNAIKETDEIPPGALGHLGTNEASGDPPVYLVQCL